jgi:virginiamycin A acetyltransferase
MHNLGRRFGEMIIGLCRGLLGFPQWLGQRLDFLANDIRIAPGTFIAPGTRIGKRTRINAASHIGRCTIGSYCAIGGRLIVRSGNHHTGMLNLQDYAQRHIIRSCKSVIGLDKGGVAIGHAVWIGDSVIVLPGVNIGNGAVIGAGSVVTKSIPPFAVAAGNPAKVIRNRFPDEALGYLEQLAWWSWDDRRIQANKWLFERDFSEPLDAPTIERLNRLLHQGEPGEA